jgi:hypothetical protein
MYFTEILTRNSQLSEELKRREKKDPNSSMKFFKDCFFKLTCRCNLNYVLQLNPDEDFQVKFL